MKNLPVMVSLFAMVVGMGAAHAQVAPGSKPPVPLSSGKAQTMGPEAISKLGADLPLVGTPSEGKQAAPGASPVATPTAAFSALTGPPGSPNLSNPLVLTDGSVILHVSCSGTWWKLTPNNAGSYAAGTWSSIAGMPAGHTPRFFSSAVLPDGRVIIEGGEYNTGCAAQWSNKGSIYDPVANSWANVAPPAGWAQIGDSQATVLADGTYFQGNCCDSGGKLSVKLNAATLTWSAQFGTGKFTAFDEEGWTLLPNGKILTVDAYVFSTCGSNTELFDPATGVWSSAGNTPSVLADCSAANAEGGNPTKEMGPQQLMYNGKVLAFGANTLNVAHTALFDTAANTWAAGPNLPSTCGTGGTTPCTMADAPSVVMPDGKVLFATSHGAFHTPTLNYEYDPATNAFTAIPGGFDSSVTSFQINFAILPNGQIIEADTDNPHLFLWTPSGSPQAAWRPVVSSVPSCVVPNGTYTASGTQFNGLSEGATYGDDQMAMTNFPIIRIVNNGTGHVFYTRTFNHSSRSIAVNASASTSFKVAAGTEAGASTLFVVANGIASAGTPITVNASSCPVVASIPHDFNGSGQSDILWRASTGDISMWFMNGTTLLSGASVGAIDPNWTIVKTPTGRGDFNADGKADILWHHTNGSLAMWLMNGATVSSGSGLGSVDTSWQIAGVGDFDGDGKSDILWRNSGGSYAIWFMNGFTVSSSAGVGAAAASWTVAAIADLNGDGKADIVLRNSGGDVAVWLMNGATITSGANLGILPAAWQIVGTGDFNGDGKGDILWRHSTGALAMWFMNGTAIASSASVGTIDPAWNVASTGDYNGNGMADILWRSTGGDVAIWLMNGVTIASGAGLGVLPATWQITE